MCNQESSRGQKSKILGNQVFTGSCLAGALTLTVLLIHGSGDGRAQQKTRQIQDAYVPQIMALLQKHDDAVNRHDLDGVVEVFAPGERTVVMGTGPNER